MVRLDVMRAALAGFGVIGRNPLAVLVWGLFILVVTVLPLLLIGGGLVSSMSALIAADAAGVEPAPEEIMPFVGAIFAMAPVMLITGLLMRVMITGAIFRAVLFPEDRKWFYLRLGARELWLGLLLIVTAVLGFIVYVAVAMLSFPLFLILGAGASAADPADPAIALLGMGVVLLLMIGYVGVFGFLIARFGMAFPMSFAQSRFRLFESWSFTRGNGWRLFMVVLLMTAILFALYILFSFVMVLVMAAVFGGMAAGGTDPTAIEAFFAQDPSLLMAKLAPWVVVGGLVMIVIGTLLTVILTAPWADAYRQLSAEGEGVATPEPELQPAG